MEKDKLVSVIYEILFCYSLDNVVKTKNAGTFIIEGLAMENVKDSVIADIVDAYTEWYLDVPAIV